MDGSCEDDESEREALELLEFLQQEGSIVELGEGSVNAVPPAHLKTVALAMVRFALREECIFDCGDVSWMKAAVPLQEATALGRLLQETFTETPGDVSCLYRIAVRTYREDIVISVDVFDRRFVQRRTETVPNYCHNYFACAFHLKFQECQINSIGRYTCDSKIQKACKSEGLSALVYDRPFGSVETLLSTLWDHALNAFGCADVAVVLLVRDLPVEMRNLISNLTHDTALVFHRMKYLVVDPHMSERTIMDFISEAASTLKPLCLCTQCKKPVSDSSGLQIRCSACSKAFCFPACGRVTAQGCFQCPSCNVFSLSRTILPSFIHGGTFSNESPYQVDVAALAVIQKNLLGHPKKGRLCTLCKQGRSKYRCACGHFYCSKEHQLSDWSRHQRECFIPGTVSLVDTIQGAETSSPVFEGFMRSLPGGLSSRFTAALASHLMQNILCAQRDNSALASHATNEYSSDEAGAAAESLSARQQGCSGPETAHIQHPMEESGAACGSWRRGRQSQ